MNKREARALADTETVTAGELRGLIKGSEGPDTVMSSLNPQFTRNVVLGWFRAGIKDMEDDKPVNTWDYDPYATSDKSSKRGRNFMTVTNILRECAPKGWKPLTNTALWKNDN